MNFSDVELPSNLKFGFFFSAVFVAVGVYSYWNGHPYVACFFVALGLLFAAIAIVKADLLLPLNKLWMRFGILIGMIVSPIVLGVIFYLLFTPIGVFMRLVGRDELRLKFKRKSTYWMLRDSSTSQNSTFKNQF